MINLDPKLPDILSGERLRRSQNLLGRVLKHLDACVYDANAQPPGAQAPEARSPQTTEAKSAPSVQAHNMKNTNGTAQSKPPEVTAIPVNPLAQRLAAAEQLFKPGAARDEDAVLTMEDTAQQLWRDKAMFCKGLAPRIARSTRCWRVPVMSERAITAELNERAKAPRAVRRLWHGAFGHLGLSEAQPYSDSGSADRYFLGPLGGPISYLD